MDIINNSIWNNSVYDRTKKKTMKKSQLVQVIKEELAKKQDIDSIITRYIDTDDSTELKAYLKTIPDRARTRIAKILKIDLNEDGYERKDGKLVPHSDKFDSTKLSSILTRIAKERPEEEGKYQGDPERGNKILDRGNPNIPLDEVDGQLYSKDDAIAYIENNRGAKYYNIGINREATQRATDPARAIEIVRDSPISQFKLTTYGDVIQFSAPYDEKYSDLRGNFAKKGLR